MALIGSFGSFAAIYTTFISTSSKCISTALSLRRGRRKAQGKPRVLALVVPSQLLRQAPEIRVALLRRADFVAGAAFGTWQVQRAELFCFAFLRGVNLDAQILLQTRKFHDSAALCAPRSALFFTCALKMCALTCALICVPPTSGSPSHKDYFQGRCTPRSFTFTNIYRSPVFMFYNMFYTFFTWKL